MGFATKRELSQVGLSGVAEMSDADLKKWLAKAAKVSSATKEFLSTVRANPRGNNQAAYTKYLKAVDNGKFSPRGFISSPGTAAAGNAMFGARGGAPEQGTMFLDRVLNVFGGSDVESCLFSYSDDVLFGCGCIVYFARLRGRLGQRWMTNTTK